MRFTDVPRDIFDVLLRDHRDLQSLCWDLEWVAERGDAISASSLLGELAIGLVEHAHLEEHLLCRRLEGSDDVLDELVRLTRAGHRGVERHLLELSGLAVTDPAWHVELAALRDLLAEHIDTEERELFVHASAELQPGEALLLGTRARELFAPDDELLELDDADLEELVEYSSSASA